MKIGLLPTLIAKSLTDLVFVSVLAVSFLFLSFPPYFRGWGEATPSTISGWVVNRAAQWDRVEVQLFIDGEFVSTAIANQSRPDVQAAGWSRDEWHGYSFQLPSLGVGPHVARVYALHKGWGGNRRTLQLVGNPIYFKTAPSGRGE